MIIKNITKKYLNKTVVDDISLEIPKGKITAMIGPNGAGKSTLFNMISRLIDSDNGNVEIDNKNLNNYTSNELSKKLAILTQTNNIQMKLTVRELVSFGRFPYSKSKLNQYDYQKVDEAIAYMELEEYKNAYIDELSGGQRQRAYIAMIIAQDTEYILLDEPTNNLDIYHSTNMMKLVRKLCDELNKTVILVLHEINYASFYCDYICALANGRIHKFGTIDEVINKETLKELYNVNFEIMKIDNKPLSIYY